ncbi:MAG: asparaginase [Halanaerobiales bacterium]
MPEILAEVYRNQLVESRHRGNVVLVNNEGELRGKVGDENTVTYWRSAAKPLQALPVIFSGAADRYGFTDKELAVMAASHNGEDRHTAAVNSILEKIDLPESALDCGIHPPLHKETANRLRAEGEKPRQIHNNCSGKHAGILTLCRFYNWPFENYILPDHPSQKLWLKVIAEITDFSEEKIYTGEDGCGVVVFGLPLRNMAYAYARLANPETLPGKYRKAAVKITSVMEENPEMVAGESRFDTDLMRVLGNRLFAKSGAEGVFSLGIHGGCGITIKIEDGRSRAIPAVVTNLLTQLNLMGEKELDELQKYYNPVIENHHQHQVGRIVAKFNLKERGI